MYKLLLAWRYLRTRYIALASIVSVMLGVATLIIVNSVMTGFAREMESRLNGMLSDVVVECHTVLGMPDPEAHAQVIREVLGDEVLGVTSTVHVPAMLNFESRGHSMTRQITFIGIDKQTYSQVSDFGNCLLHPENRRELSFDLRESGYAPGRREFPELAGWPHRRMRADYDRIVRENQATLDGARPQAPTANGIFPDNASLDDGAGPPMDPTGPPLDPTGPTVDPTGPPLDPTGPPLDPTGEADVVAVFDPAREQHPGIILGIALCTVRQRNPKSGEVEEVYLLQPGDDVQVTFPKCSVPVQPDSARFTVVDFFESKMSEYDSTFAFIPLGEMQRIRAMYDPDSRTSTISALQIKLRPGADLNAARDKLQERFPAEAFPYSIRTWRDLQGPLLAAVQMETTILNILLFLIIAVAGFGILATFFMIVVEKTRDVGVLKALGAPSRGVLSIFLGYGVALGLVGAGVGTVLGLVFVANLNEVAHVIEGITGREVFDPTVYYFTEIPAHVEPLMVTLVVAGAVGIAVMASVLPAFRAARLHPVEALRHE